MMAMGAAIALSMSSCGDTWLNLEPTTSIPSASAIATVSDAEAMLNGVYATMQNAYCYTGRFIYYGDVTADDMQAVGYNKRAGNAYGYMFTPSSVASSYWSYPYYMLNSINTVLGCIDNLETNDKELKDYDKGVALAMRAMMHFELVKFFGYPYKKDNGASLGVPLATAVIDGSAKPARNTVAEVYEQIIKDLNDADALLNNKYGNAVKTGYITRPAVLTLLSRVYLYHGDDKAALDAAEAAMKSAKDAGFKLWTNDKYATAWADSGVKGSEILFCIVNTTVENPGNESVAYLNSSSASGSLNGKGYDDYVVTSSFYSMLAEDPADVRLKLINVDPNGLPYLNKFQMQNGESVIYHADIPVIRLSEAYLNAAEAAVKTNDNAKAVTYLNEIVNRANPANSVSGTVTIDQVMKERRKELVGEGHRFFDALRDGGSFTRTDKDVSAYGITVSHLGNYPAFDWNNKNAVLPITLSEIDANSNIKQNPGF